MKGLVAAALAAGLAVAVIGTAILASAASLLGVGGGAPAASSAAKAQIPSLHLRCTSRRQPRVPGSPGRSWQPSAPLSRTMASRTCRVSTAVPMRRVPRGR